MIGILNSYNQGKGYVNNIKIKYATDVSIVVLEAGSGVLALNQTTART